MNKLAKLSIIIFLPVFVLFIVFQFSVFNINYFENKFIENNTSEITGLKLEQLIEVSVDTLEYLNNKRDNLVILEEINGEKIQVFKDRELDHMKDVKELFIKGFQIRNLTAIITFMSLLYLFLKDKKGLFKSIRTGSILYLLIFSIIGVYAFIDFDNAFVIFHKILFSNDLWILDPNEDIMIQMLPLDFFMGIGIKIAAGYLLYLILSAVSANIIISKMLNR